MLPLPPPEDMPRKSPFLLGECVEITGPAHKTTADHSEYKHDWGIVTRVGSSDFGGWYEIECGLTVEYRRKGVLLLVFEPESAASIRQRIEEHNKKESTRSAKSLLRERERQRARDHSAKKRQQKHRPDKQKKKKKPKKQGLPHRTFSSSSSSASSVNMAVPVSASYYASAAPSSVVLAEKISASSSFSSSSYSDTLYHSTSARRLSSDSDGEEGEFDDRSPDQTDSEGEDEEAYFSEEEVAVMQESASPRLKTKRFSSGPVVVRAEKFTQKTSVPVKRKSSSHTSSQERPMKKHAGELESAAFLLALCDAAGTQSSLSAPTAGHSSSSSSVHRPSKSLSPVAVSSAATAATTVSSPIPELVGFTRSSSGTHSGSDLETDAYTHSPASRSSGAGFSPQSISRQIGVPVKAKSFVALQQKSPQKQAAPMPSYSQAQWQEHGIQQHQIQYQQQYLQSQTQAQQSLVQQQMQMQHQQYQYQPHYIPPYSQPQLHTQTSYASSSLPQPPMASYPQHPYSNPISHSYTSSSLMYGPSSSTAGYSYSLPASHSAAYQPQHAQTMMTPPGVAANANPNAYAHLYATYPKQQPMTISQQQWNPQQSLPQ